MTIDTRAPRFILVAGAILAFLFVWPGEALAGMDFQPDEFVPRLVRTLLAVLPFLFLSISADNLLKSGRATAATEIAGAAALVTVGFLLLWGWYLLEAMGPAEGGANIGLGIIMIFSPLMLALLIPAGRALGRLAHKARA